MSNNYKICTKCVMDTTDSEITFDENGVCNHCQKYAKRVQRDLHYDEAGQQKLNQLINKIKKDGENKKHDCLIGLSGGVDSTTVAYWVKELGLRSLAIHLDNGWDSALSVKNIKNIVKKLNLDFYTLVPNWEEFKNLQLSYLKASVANCEIPTDHAIIAAMYHVAAKEGIRYIITGGNVVTEGVLPVSWGYNAQDWRSIKNIHKKFGRAKLKNFPHLTLFDWINYILIKRIKYIHILNYIPYVKKDAKRLIQEKLGWEDYGGKHCESIYTRFFQGYILPVKFGFDKRRAHLSSLICSGQMTRKEALKELEQCPYPNEILLKEDKEYVIKKLGLTEDEFEKIMAQPAKTFRDYPNNHFLFSKLNFFIKLVRKIAVHDY